MDGRRPMGGILDCTRSFLGEQALRLYYSDQAKKRDHTPLPDVTLLRFICRGKENKSQWKRAEYSKFIHGQLATASRLRGWGVPIARSQLHCAACALPVDETLEHLLTECIAQTCCDARIEWKRQLDDFLAKSRQRATLRKHLDQHLILTPDHKLAYDDCTQTAARLLRLHLPTDFASLLRDDALLDPEASVGEGFVRWLKRTTSKVLWWPTWQSARDRRYPKHPDSHRDDTSPMDTSDDSLRDPRRALEHAAQAATAHITGYASDDEAPTTILEW